MPKKKKKGLWFTTPESIREYSLIALVSGGTKIVKVPELNHFDVHAATILKSRGLNNFSTLI